MNEDEMGKFARLKAAVKRRAYAARTGLPAYGKVVPGRVPLIVTLPTRPRVAEIEPVPVVGPTQLRFSEMLGFSPATALTYLEPENRGKAVFQLPMGP